LLDQAASAAHQGGDAFAKSFVELVRATSAFSEGRHRAAVQTFEAAAQQFVELPGRRFELNYARMNLQNLYWLLGEIKTQRAAAMQWLRESEDCGDRFLATFVQAGGGTAAWLMLDDPAQSEQRATEAMRRWSQRDYHFQHWNYLHWSCNRALYCDEPGRALARLETEVIPLRRSLLPRSLIIGTFLRDVRSRAKLAEATRRDPTDRRALVKQVRADIPWLRRNRSLWAIALADLFDASCLAVEGRRDAALAGLQRAIASLDAADMNLYAACARWRLGDVLGGDEGAALRARGRQFMEDADIRAPEKVLRLLAPGFASDGY